MVPSPRSRDTLGGSASTTTGSHGGLPRRRPGDVLIAIRILLLDENDDFLDGLSDWLSGRPGVEVVGVAHSAAEAIERSARLRPDLVVVDMSLPDASGLDVPSRLKTGDGAPLVYLMTFHDSVTFRAEARAAGADGCFAKTRITAEFPVALRLLHRARAAGAVRAEGPGDVVAFPEGLPPEAK